MSDPEGTGPFGRTEPIGGRPRPPLLGTRATAQRFADVARRIPDRIAVSDLTTAITYRELAAATAMTAEDSAKRAPGAVLLRADDAIGFAIGMLAAVCSGRSCVVAPESASPSALQTLADHTGACVLVGEPGDLGATTELPLVPIVRPGQQPTEGVDLRELIRARDDAGADWQDLTAHDATSGSTGAPKVIGQRSLLAWGRRLPELDELDAPDRGATNMSNSSAFRTRLARMLLSGDSAIAFHLGSLAPRTLLQHLQEARVTLLMLAPTILRRLDQMAAGRVQLTDVQEIQSIGEPLSWEDVARLRGLCGPGVIVSNLYGSTEAGLVTQRVVQPEEPIGTGLLSVGHPIGDRHVWIADESGDPAPTGTVGTVVIDGAFLTTGVALERLDDGAARFRSEDLGRLDDDGALWLEGRASRMLKVAGVRVDPAAVEDVLRALPGVAETAVVPVSVGADEWRLVAHVVVRSGAASAEQLRAHAVAHLVPMAVPARFVLHDAPLPLLASGKVDLVTLAREPTPPDRDASRPPEA